MAEPATQLELAPVTDLSGGLMAIIASAARDPSVDIDKMERLLQMKERVEAREAKSAYTRALAELQTVLPVIGERGEILDKNKRVQSTYALWEDINDAIKPILAEKGFALSFRPQVRDGSALVVGTLSHVAGHSEEGEMALPSDTSGSKNAVQAVGSSTSYAKRYIAAALLNLTSRGEDDDGVKGGLGLLVDDAQLCALQNLASGVGADTRRFCEYFGVKSLNAIPAFRFEEAMQALQAKARNPEVGK
jgi:hypothetical protein